MQWVVVLGIGVICDFTTIGHTIGPIRILGGPVLPSGKNRGLYIDPDFYRTVATTADAAGVPARAPASLTATTAGDDGLLQTTETETI